MSDDKTEHCNESDELFELHLITGEVIYGIFDSIRLDKDYNDDYYVIKFPVKVKTENNKEINFITYNNFSGEMLVKFNINFVISYSYIDSSIENSRQEFFCKEYFRFFNNFCNENVCTDDEE